VGMERGVGQLNSEGVIFRLLSVLSLLCVSDRLMDTFFAPETLLPEIGGRPAAVSTPIASR